MKLVKGWKGGLEVESTLTAQGIVGSGPYSRQEKAVLTRRRQ